MPVEQSYRGAAPRIYVLGSLNADLVIQADRLPHAGETLTGGDLKIFPGGKGANQAAAAARLGGGVSMIGQVGNDTFGDFLVESQVAAGSDVSGIGRSESSSGVAMITILPTGENAIVISPGANATLTPEIALERLKGLRAGSFLLCQLEVPLETVEAALSFAKQAGATTILDPAPAQPLPKRILRNTDILTPNQTEAAVLLGEPEMKIESFEQAADAAEKLRSSGPGAVVMTLGALGCLVAASDLNRSVAGFEVDAVDTTAAGDTFNGALAVALAGDLAVDKAALFGNAAAALSVTRPGAQSSAPTRLEVEEFLDSAASRRQE